MITYLLITAVKNINEIMHEAEVSQGWLISNIPMRIKERKL